MSAAAKSLKDPKQVSLESCIIDGMKDTHTIGQTLFGLLVLALGVGFLLDALNLIDFGSAVATWWPLGVVAIGVASFISNPRTYVWPLIIVIVGVLLQIRQLGWLDFSVWSLIWPSVVILFGLSLIFNLGHRDKARSIKEDDVDLFVAFSGTQARSVSDQFGGGKATAVFGGIELDLTDAKLKGTANIDVFTAFGGIDIRVPDGWTVVVKGLPIFGGWEDKTRKPRDAKNAPALVINGTCLFGGVTVKN